MRGTSMVFLASFMFLMMFGMVGAGVYGWAGSITPYTRTSAPCAVNGPTKVWLHYECYLNPTSEIWESTIQCKCAANCDITGSTLQRSLYYQCSFSKTEQKTKITVAGAASQCPGFYYLNWNVNQPHGNELGATLTADQMCDNDCSPHCPPFKAKSVAIQPTCLIPGVLC